MSSNNFNFNSPAGLQKVDYYGIFREVWAQKALIIILSVAVGLFAFSFNSLTYEAEYETMARGSCPRKTAESPADPGVSFGFSPRRDGA